MKKKIEFANLTSSLASWILEKLKAAPLDVGNMMSSRKYGRCKK